MLTPIQTSELPRNGHRRPRPRWRGLGELVIALVMMVVIALAMLPVLIPQRSGDRTVCLSHMRQLGRALTMYVEDSDHRLPPATQKVGENTRYWPSLLSQYVKGDDVFRCPVDLRKGDLTSSDISYGYNGLGLTRNGNGLPMSVFAAPVETVALVDSTDRLAAPTPIAGTMDSTAPVYRHEHRAVVTWLDGHAQAWSKSQLEANPGTERQHATVDPIDGFQYWNRF
jgi:prepilin-type processing-associated H-X9-DG protein